MDAKDDNRLRDNIKTDGIILWKEGNVTNDYKQLLAIQAQQVVEEFLKHLVSIFCVDHIEANNVIDKHSLKKVNSILRECDVDLDIDLKDLTFLQDYYFDARYPGYDFVVVTQEEAKLCIDVVEEIKNKVQDFMISKGYCIKCGNKLISIGQCSYINCK